MHYMKREQSTWISKHIMLLWLVLAFYCSSSINILISTAFMNLKSLICANVWHYWEVRLRRLPAAFTHCCIYGGGKSVENSWEVDYCHPSYHWLMQSQYKTALQYFIYQSIQNDLLVFCLFKLRHIPFILYVISSWWLHTDFCLQYIITQFILFRYNFQSYLYLCCAWSQTSHPNSKLTIYCLHLNYKY